MTKRLVIVIAFICACVKTQAQLNLVRNGGFEQYINCPGNYDEVSYAPPWNGIDTNWSPGDPIADDPPCLPDYINGCSLLGITGEPVNGHFFQYPHHGNGMMQMVLYFDTVLYGTTIENNYLQQQLRSTLIAGKSYCVTFYATLENFSGFAVNNIGAYFDDGIIDTTTHCSAWQTEYTPQILETSIVADTLNWTKIEGNFIANGTEKFITIGNFFDTAHTAHIPLLAGEHQGFYLIDDVSVIASDATANAGPDMTIAPGDSVWIGDSTGDGMPCYWYVLGSTAPIDSGGKIQVHPSDSTTYVVSMDLCGTVTYDTVRVNVSTLSIKNVQMQNVQIFPNPASTQLTITAGYNITNVSIANVVGQTVYNQSYNSKRVQVNVADLPAGIYFVKVNEVVVRRFVKE